MEESRHVVAQCPEHVVVAMSETVDQEVVAEHLQDVLPAQVWGGGGGGGRGVSVVNRKPLM